MAKTEVILQREQERKKRKAIQDRIDELVTWLSNNAVSNTAWDENVRELNASEIQLEMMDQQVKKSNCVEYGISLLVSVPMNY